MDKYMVVRFRIKDYKQFKKEFDASEDLIHKGGFTKTWLNRNVDNPDEIFVVHEVGDLDKARKFVQSPELKEAMTRGGVIGKPEITFMEELMRMPETSKV